MVHFSYSAKTSRHSATSLGNSLRKKEKKEIWKTWKCIVNRRSGKKKKKKGKNTLCQCQIGPKSSDEQCKTLRRSVGNRTVIDLKGSATRWEKQTNNGRVGGSLRITKRVPVGEDLEGEFFQGRYFSKDFFALPCEHWPEYAAWTRVSRW